MLELDHIVVCASTLDEGTGHVEALLGVPLEAGGQHAFMGTHNTLLSLGPGQYLEVIAIDPDAPSPNRPRWFGLDDFKGPPRLTNWVCRSDDIAADMARAPNGMSEIIDATRGDLLWKMALSAAGQYPFGGAFPGIIAWERGNHPAQRLPDRGIRLTELHIAHPEAEQLRIGLPNLATDGLVSFEQTSQAGLKALLGTPHGEVTLT